MTERPVVLLNAIFSSQSSFLSEQCHPFHVRSVCYNCAGFAKEETKDKIKQKKECNREKEEKKREYKIKQKKECNREKEEKKREKEIERDQNSGKFVKIVFRRSTARTSARDSCEKTNY